MDDKEMLELVKSNVKLAANMESMQKDLAKLVNLIEKDVKEDLKEIDTRVDILEKKEAKFNGMYIVIAVLSSAVFSFLMKLATPLIN